MREKNSGGPWQSSDAVYCTYTVQYTWYSRIVRCWGSPHPSTGKEAILWSEASVSVGRKEGQKGGGGD